MKYRALIATAVIGLCSAGVASSEAWREAERGVGVGDRSSSGKSGAKRIDVNVASARELQQLPGIGPTLAERLVQHRPYHKLDELIAKKVLGAKEFARIKERIRVNRTPDRKS